MTYQVIFFDTIPDIGFGNETHLLKEFKDLCEAKKFGLNEAKGYCQEKEKPYMFKEGNNIIIETPTDFVIVIRVKKEK